MQGAKNQLATRGNGKPVKKAIAGWVTALVKVHFAGLEKISEQTALDALKDAQDARKGEERDAKRRKREDAAAARGASSGKKAGIALPRELAESLPPNLRGLESLKARLLVGSGVLPDSAKAKMTRKGNGNSDEAPGRATSGKGGVATADKVSLGEVVPGKETQTKAAPGKVKQERVLTSKEGAGREVEIVPSTEIMAAYAGGNDSTGARAEERQVLEVIEIED